MMTRFPSETKPTKKIRKESNAGTSAHPNKKRRTV